MLSRQSDFYTKTGTLIAVGYRRLVVGGRGSYVEFDDTQINHDVLVVPAYAEFRKDSAYADQVFYEEMRSDDASNVKVYYQKRHVGYADYKPGYYYISVEDLEWGDDELSEELPI